MTKAIIVNGEGGVGKSTFVKACIDYLTRTGKYGVEASSVDEVKKAAYLLGWDGEKDQKGRQFLHDLKMLSTKAYDGPMVYMKQRLHNSGADFIFFHVREPLEIRKFVDTVPGTFTVKIIRKAVEGQFINPADGGVHDYDYDMIIVNDNTLETLRTGAKDFMIFMNAAQ